MVWKSRIRSASFRGVPFGVTADDKEGGRRTVVHEYPQRDDVYVEDLGGAPIRFVVQAFVVGPQYMTGRDALERALAMPGPGTLVHPWYGEVTVSQFAPYKVKHSAADGGMAVFTLSFARDAGPAAPSATVNPLLRALEFADRAGPLVSAVFDVAFDLAGQGAWVAEEAYHSVSTAVSRVQAALGGDMQAAVAALGPADGGRSMAAWFSPGQRLRAVFQELGEAALASDWIRVAAEAVPTPLPDKPGSTRARIAANDLAVNAFTRRAAMVEAAAALARTEPESRGQAGELREGFVDALDAVLLELDSLDAARMAAAAQRERAVGLARRARASVPQDAGPSVIYTDALYAAFADLRAQTLAALAEAARSAPEIVSFTPAMVLPSLVLCYRLSGGIALDADFITRNHVLHPGFVPVEQLEVLLHA